MANRTKEADPQIPTVEINGTLDTPCFAFVPQSEYVNTNRGRVRGSRIIGNLGESVFKEQVSENK